MGRSLIHLRRSLHRHPLAWLTLIAVVLVVPRGWSMDRAQSLRFDDAYHVSRGLLFLSRDFAPVGKTLQLLNDPPLGQAIVALPAWLLGARADGVHENPFLGQPISAEFMQRLLAVWKTLLFIPVVLVGFVWARQTYNTAAGWVAGLVLATEPNFAAHIPIPALDVLSVGWQLIACWLGWRFFQRPTWPRALVVALTVAVALLTKHTSVLLPPILLAMALLAPRGPDQDGPLARLLLRRVGIYAGCGVLCVLMIWPLTLFDVSRPWRPGRPERRAAVPAAVRTVLDQPLPAGVYLRSFLDGASHGAGGHPGYLRGQVRRTGWWYYFPYVATLKVPLGLWGCFALAIVSLALCRFGRQELGLLIPAVGFTLFLLTIKINIGFRHFLPAYVFWILWGTRVMLVRQVWVRGLAVAGVVAAALHGAIWHPDEIAYFNRPIDRPYRLINDSNVDWGQSLKQVAAWLARSDTPRPEEVSVAAFRYVPEAQLRRYLPREIEIVPFGYRPTRRYLIASPIRLTAAYGDDPVLEPLMDARPIATIGHDMPVFDRKAAGTRAVGDEISAAATRPIDP